MVRQLLRFGDCTLDIAARELRRGGERVELSPTVFDCIAYLVEHRARAVGRDELVAAVWARTSISDTMLGKAILAARRALGDDAERQALLRTVPRFGYHFVGAVEPVTAAMDLPATQPAVVGPAPQAPVDKPDDARLPVSGLAAENLPPAAAAVPTASPGPGLDSSRQRRRSSDALRLVAILAVIAAVFFAARHWLTLPGPPTAAQQPAPLVVAATPLPDDSCAILPAEIAADAADSWLRLGVMDLMATRLRMAGLPVLSSDSVVRLAPEGTSAEAAAASLRRAADVQHLIQPALRRSGHNWIARAELSASDGSRRAVQAEADNPIAAANAVADQLLGLLGRRVEPAAGVANLSLAELLQRVDAARLSDQMDQARALMASASAAQQREPELRLRQIQLDLRAGDLAAARRGSEALLADVPAETDPVMHGRALESDCVALSRAGDMAAALAACDGAIDLLQSRNQPLALGRAYNHRGIIHARELRRELALVDFSHARVVLGTVGDPLLLAMVDGNESALAMDHGRPAEALPGLLRAGQQFQRFGMRSEFAVAVINQVETQLALLQPLPALQASEQNWTQRQQLADPALRQRLAYERAEALAANGRLAEARSLFDEVLHGADAVATPLEQALARGGLARQELRAGQAAGALRLAQQAQGELTPAELARQRAQAWLSQVYALLLLQRVAEADQQKQAFRRWAATAKPEAAVLAELAAAAVARAQGQDENASAAFAEARKRADGQGRPDIQAQAAAAYAEDRLARGDLRGAAEPIGQLARHAETDFDAALLQWRLYLALDQDEAAAAALIRLRRLAGERPVPLLAAPGGVAVARPSAPEDRP